MLPHLDSGYAVDQAILSEEERVVVIRFGHDWDPVILAPKIQFEPLPSCRRAIHPELFQRRFPSRFDSSVNLPLTGPGVHEDGRDVVSYGRKDKELLRNVLHPLPTKRHTLQPPPPPPFAPQCSAGGSGHTHMIRRRGQTFHGGCLGGDWCCRVFKANLCNKENGRSFRSTFRGNADAAPHLAATWWTSLRSPTSTRCTSCTTLRQSCSFTGASQRSCPIPPTSRRPPPNQQPLPDRNKHIMIDLGTGNNNKINWPMTDKQEFIDIVEVIPSVVPPRPPPPALSHLSPLQPPPAPNPEIFGLELVPATFHGVERAVDVSLPPPNPPYHHHHHSLAHLSPLMFFPLLHKLTLGPPKIQTVYRGARKGRGLVVSPKDYSTKYKY